MCLYVHVNEIPVESRKHWRMWQLSHLSDHWERDFLMLYLGFCHY